MERLIKTEVLLDDSGKEFNTGKHHRSTMYLLQLSRIKQQGFFLIHMGEELPNKQQNTLFNESLH